MGTALEPIVHRNLASLCLSTGDFEGALKESYEAFRLAGEMNNKGVQLWALVFKGRALLGLKDMDGARKTADELLLTLKDVLGNYGMSWDMTVLENSLYLDALAQAYYRSGKLGPAKAKYEEIASTGLFRFEPDSWIKSFYWRGRIAGDRGKKAEARENYGKFLDLWKDADPSPPEVEDARKRLAGLQSQ